MTSQYKTRADLSAHPEFAFLYKDTEGVPCVWRHTFECQDGHDLEVWSDEWSCTCDGSCPVCGSDHTPVSVWIGPVGTEALELWNKLPETLEAASSEDSASPDQEGMTVD